MLATDIPFLVHFWGYVLALSVAAWASALRRGRDPGPQQGVPTELFRSWDLAVVFLLTQVFCGMVLISMADTDAPPPSLGVSSLVASMTFQGIMAGLVVLLVSTRSGVAAWLGLRWRKWIHVLWIAPLSVIVMWSLMGVLMASGYIDLMERLGAEPVQETVRVLQESDDLPLLAAMTVAAVLVAPVCEEVIFRGYCYPVLKKHAGPGVALLSTSLFFACAHGSLVSFAPLFLLGGLLVFVYERTGSLWAPVAVHFLFNSVTVLVQFGGRWYGFPGSE